MRYPRCTDVILVGAALAALVLCAVPAAQAAVPDLGDHRDPGPKTGSAPPAGPLAPPPAGGEDVASATPIPALPFSGGGTTCGALDDYDASCDWASAAPDLVYAYTAPAAMHLDIDLCGSSYDTKVFLLDGTGSVLACNEDYYGPGDPCGTYVSRLLGAPLGAGQTVYIVIDGYGDACGDYMLQVSEHVPCSLACPDAVPEDEPALHDGYVDHYNSGCNNTGSSPAFMTLYGDQYGMVNLCGATGFYVTGGLDYRDTDWYAITVGETGEVVWQLDAEFATWGFVLDLACPDPPVYSAVLGGPCDPQGMSIFGPPGTKVGLWVGPPVYEPPLGMSGHEYAYHMLLSGVSPHRAVAVVSTSWGALKSRYR